MPCQRGRWLNQPNLRLQWIWHFHFKPSLARRKRMQFITGSQSSEHQSTRSIQGWINRAECYTSILRGAGKLYTRWCVRIQVLNQVHDNQFCASCWAASHPKSYWWWWNSHSDSNLRVIDLRCESWSIICWQYRHSEHFHCYELNIGYLAKLAWVKHPTRLAQCCSLSIEQADSKRLCLKHIWPIRSIFVHEEAAWFNTGHWQWPHAYWR